MNVNEKIKEYWEKLKVAVGKVNKKIRNLVLAFIIVVLVIIVAVTVYSKTQYAVLFTGLTTEDAQSVLSYLDENNVTGYRYDGDTIRVPANQEAQLKAALLLAGFPDSGYGYETYYSAIGTMSTQSDRTIAYQQDLQDRMAAVIRHMGGIQSAVVTLAPGDDNRYVLDQSNMTHPSASVMVTMQPGTKLSTQQANAIRHLVTHSVQGLDFAQVTITDSNGNLYSATNDLSGDISDASYLKLQLEEEVNNTIRTEILKVLSPLFGSQNVTIAVNSTVDVRRSVSEAVTYTEPEWAILDGAGGRGIIGQQIYDWQVTRDPDDPIGGVVGTETNSDIPTYPEFGSAYQGDESYWSSQGTLNYETDTETTQTERYAAIVTDLMVAVTINSETSAGVNTRNLSAHVARAAGISELDEEGRISIFIAPFYKDPSDTSLAGGGFFTTWMIYAAIAGVALLLIVLIVIGILRGRSKRKKKKQLKSMLNQQMTLVDEAAGASGADIMELKTEKSMELRKDIRQFAEENPEIAAFMLKNWLRGGEQDG